VGFVCAAVGVSLDYAAPRGRSITLAVVKHPATGALRGTLFMNPGGPGGLGTVQIPQWYHFVAAGLRAGYDIVSWDPRGIGGSTAVQCFPNADAEAAFLGPYADFPADPAQQSAYIARWAQFGRICAARNGDLLAHVSTAETARDLDLLRRAVGARKLDYIGLSYGTFLGAAYANLFPRKVGALVLDGNLAPSAWTGVLDPALSISMRVGSDQSAAATLYSLLTQCGQTSTTNCAFSAGSPSATIAKFYALFDRLRRGPITLPNGVSRSYARLLDELSDALDIARPAPGIAGWHGAAVALQEFWAARNNTPPATPPAAPAPPTTVSSYPGAEQALSVICADVPSPRASAFPALAASAVARGNIISQVAVWGDEPCSTWPVHTRAGYRGPWNTPTKPILVVGNTLDPSTPYHNSLLMTQELANARLLTVDGYGHTAVLNPSSCADQAMAAYIARGALPPARQLCRQDKAPFQPPFPTP
jgi:pimeloyl-ACP methyl ester carboxylesterase